MDYRQNGNGVQHRPLYKIGNSVTFIGHATVCIQMDGVTLITDPLLRDRIWHLRRDTPCDTCQDLPLERVSGVLISHLHLDHADIASLRLIPSSVPLIAPEGTGGYLRARLAQPVYTVEVGQRYRIGEVEVIAVQANHSGPGLSLMPISSCLGFIVRGSKSVYFAGDTGLFDQMRLLGQKFDIDLALLPVWGYGPNLRGEHMTPRDAAQALTLLNPRVAVPIHWGTFRPLGKVWSKMNYFNDPPYTFAGYAAQMAPRTRIQILQPGESVAL
jgi:L-ascorbate metabolism protein UlaG (beta-lactamase superfamily)